MTLRGKVAGIYRGKVNIDPIAARPGTNRKALIPDLKGREARFGRTIIFIKACIFIKT